VKLQLYVAFHKHPSRSYGASPATLHLEQCFLPSNRWMCCTPP